MTPSTALVPTIDDRSRLDSCGQVARPFVRWVGGKSRLLDAIVPYVPLRFKNYYEPFLGSGAVFFSVGGRAEGVCLLSDLNSELINAWNVVRTRHAELLVELEKYEGRDTEVDYYSIRSATPTTNLERAARFFYLNQTAWNGLWRVNRWGVFNVPWGARPFRGFDPNHLNASSRSLAGVGLAEQDFRAALATAGEGDFVYLDPPYLPVSDTSKFSGYTQKRFRAADLAELAQVCADLTRRGAVWILSNRDTPLVRELFRDAALVPFTTRRSVAAQNKRNVQPADSPEILVIGGRRD